MQGFEVIEALQKQLLKQKESHGGCAAFILQRLPQLLLREPPISPESGATEVVERYARLEDTLLAEMSLGDIEPSLPELRALAAAFHAVARAEIAERERVRRSDTPTLESQPDSETCSGMHADLLRKVAHDLRTPVQAILGWVDLLKSERLSSEARSRALLAIERNAKAQSELIAEVLKESASRLGHG